MALLTHAWSGPHDTLLTFAIESLNAFSLGACLITARRKVLVANRLATEIIAANGVLRMDRDRHIRLPRATHAEAQAFFAIAERPHGRADLRLERNAGRPPLYLVLTSGDRLAPAATLILIDPERRHPVDDDALRHLYGLTKAEARLAALLAEGRRLDAAAREHGIAYETARTHLRRIFHKTDTDRQSELMRLILTGPAVVGRMH